MWTKRSYNAIFDWIDRTKREKVKAILEADGLHDVVERLEASTNAGVWYRITNEAAETVGDRVIEQSAMQAETELDDMVINKGGIK